MANEEQLSILKQGVEVWNKWRKENPDTRVNLYEADLRGAKLQGAKLMQADLQGAELIEADLRLAEFWGSDLSNSNLGHADLSSAMLSYADLSNASLLGANLSEAFLQETQCSGAYVGDTFLTKLDLSSAMGLKDAKHFLPSCISTDTFILSKGNIPDAFLRGCGLSDWEIEEVKLYNPGLTNEEIDKNLYKIHDLRATRSIQISPLFISYSHADTQFADKVANTLTEKGIRYWRDIYDLKAERVETQIDMGIRQNPTVLLILSENSINSDWIQHEVRTARALEKELGRDVLCPVALDDSWKHSPWPKHVMEQIMEYNILDFSTWEDDSKFDDKFRKLVDGLELFCKG